MNPQSPWLRGAVIVAVVFVCQEAVFRGLRIDGIRTDLLLGLGVVTAIVAGAERGAAVAFIAALLGDLFVNTPFGLSALVACVVAFLAGSVQAGIGAGHRWSVPTLTALASALGVVLWALLGTVLGLPGLLGPRLLVVAVVVASVNALVSVPLAVLMRWVFAGVSVAPSAGASRGYVA